jgi:hypothetical protein
MELATMISGWSMLRDIKSFWNDLDDNSQAKFEKVLAAAVTKFIPEDDEVIAPVRAHLLTQEIPLVERVTMAALHPGTKSFFQGKAKTFSGGPVVKRALSQVPSDIMVVCNNCGMAKAVHLHDEDNVADATLT